jgi:two-component system chemotaxis response regulator CheY
MAAPRTALIVDDESHVRTFLRLLLKEVGIDTTWEAGNGAEALQLAAQNHPDLILLDLNMPVVGGIDTLKRLQQHHADVPVIVVTSQNALQTVQNAAEFGAVGYILKQSPKPTILAALRETLARLESEI